MSGLRCWRTKRGPRSPITQDLSPKTQHLAPQNPTPITQNPLLIDALFRASVQFAGTRTHGIVCYYSKTGARCGQTNLSAEANTAQAGARLPQAYEQTGRAQRPPSSSAPWTPALDGRVGPAGESRAVMQRAHRLRHAADFQRVRDQRRSWRHPLLVLFVAPNDGQATRLGISVGRRVGNAVVRNRVKRRVREAVRHRHPDLLPGHDLVFIARPPAAATEWPALRDATEELLRRARVLPASSRAAVGSAVAGPVASAPASAPADA